MDIATIVGILVSSALVVIAIVLGGSPIMFVDIKSFCIVIGGTLGATFVRNPLNEVLGTARVIGKAFSTKAPVSSELLDRIVELSQKARKEGLLALEDEPIDYPFLEKAIGMCVDGIDEEDARSVLQIDMRTTGQRHRRGQEILKGMGSAAPAFGMIGTLVGLVQMLAAMEDPSSIGPAMALALLTTLYGAIFANVFCLPLADKLKVRSEQEQLAMSLCLQGIIGLAQGVNPKALHQQLGVFLSPKARVGVSGPKAIEEAA